MMFALEKQECILENFNPRREIHGEDPQPASDLKLVANLDAGELALFHPTLRSFLFWKAEDDGPDMVNAQLDTPNVRFPKLKTPLRWDDEVVGAYMTIEHGLGGKSDLNFEQCKVNNFDIEPAEGGRFTLTVRVQCHPGEREAGKLYLLQGEKITVTLTPPESDQAQIPDKALNTAGDAAPKRGRGKSRTAELV
jgi:hypothetical protein